MGSVHITRSADAPVADVHAFVVDPYQHPRWLGMVRKISDVDGRLSTLGASYEAEIDVAGTLVPTRWTCIAADPPTTTVLEGTSEDGGAAELVITLGALGDRTEIQLELTYTLPGGVAATIADRLYVERVVARQIERSLELLAALAIG